MHPAPSPLAEFLQQNWTEQLPVINGILFANSTLLEWTADHLDPSADLPIGCLYGAKYWLIPVHS